MNANANGPIEHIQAVESTHTYMPNSIKKAWKNLMIEVGLRTDYSGVLEEIETKNYIIPEEAYLKQLRRKMWYSSEKFMTNEITMHGPADPGTHINFAKIHFIPYNLTCFLTDYGKYFCKNEALAKSLWDEHELALYSQPPNFRKALRCANLALSFMPVWPNYGHLVEAYCRRFEVWKMRGDWSSALRDLNTAASLPFNYSPALQLRIINEQILIIALRDQGDLANGNGNAIAQNGQNGPGQVVAPLAGAPVEEEVEEVQVLPEPITDEELTRIYRDQVLFKTIAEPNPVLLSASGYLKLARTMEDRRYIITTEDLEPAATVIVEEPFATVTTGALRFEHDYCHRCLKKIELMIPCDKCVFAVYCSVDCRIRDSETHNLECGCLGILHALKAGPFVHLALRCVCKAGPIYIYSMYQDRWTSQRHVIKGVDPRSGLYESDTYHQMVHLNGVCKFDRVAEMAWTAIALTQILDDRTNFFKLFNINGERKDLDSFKEFVATLFLQHFEAFPLSAIAVHKQKHSRFNDVSSQPDAPAPIGLSIYSLASILTHSCDPNVSKYIRPDGTMAIVTNRHLKKGTELTISAGPHYGYYDLKTRQSKIRKVHLVDCTCVACKMNYPKFPDFPNQVKWYCEKCKIDFESGPLAELVKNCAMEPDPEGGATCPRCKKHTVKAKMEEKAAYYYNVMTKGAELAKLKKYAEAIVMYADAVKFLQSHTAPPSTFVVQVQKRLSDVLVKVMLFDEEQRE